MPRVPKYLPFSRRYANPETGMYMLPRGYAAPFSMDARRGYGVGPIREGMTYRGRPVELIQGPQLPHLVEEKRQRYLDALDDYRAELMNMRKEQEYNSALPERARQLKQRKMDEFFGDANHPEYNDDVDKYFDDQVFEELDKRDLFY